MEKLSSRQNGRIRHIRELASSAELRHQENCFLCDGEKLLVEALRSGAEIESVFWRGNRMNTYPAFPEETLLTDELFDYVSPMKNSPGPLFTVRCRETAFQEKLSCALVLEGVQDPGNVGTVLRSADAFGTDAVILLEGCADLYAPKTVRATMGAIFRQNAVMMKREQLPGFCSSHGLRLLGAALSANARSVKEISLRHTAVAIGSEGRGLSRELLDLCEETVIIPMCGEAESLNAAVAASVLMWEMRR
ncbi:MAG: RNA methyltransferase [Oscillospiraceae bacterium]|nr:RNA methyltransferase [Oscillospiraceae bacterium]